MTAALNLNTTPAIPASPGAASAPLLDALHLAKSLPTWTKPPISGAGRAKLIAATMPSEEALRAAEGVLGRALFGPPAEKSDVAAAAAWTMAAFFTASAGSADVLAGVLMRQVADKGLSAAIICAALMRIAASARTPPPPADAVDAVKAIRLEVEVAHADVVAALRLRRRAEMILRAARSPP